MSPDVTTSPRALQAKARQLARHASPRRADSPAITAALAAILILAAVLRLWNLDATEFKYDEARVCNLAAHWIDSGIPPLRGMGSSAGIDNPPLFIYVLSLPILFSRDPLVVSAFIALSNVAAVWGCYRLGRRRWGLEVGLLAALLLAVSPWAVFYSRKVWAQDLLLPGVILFVSWLYAWLLDRARWALSAAIVTLAALTQIHFAALGLFPILALVLLLAVVHHARQRQLTLLWKPLGIGLGASLLLYTPYLVFDAFIGWRNVKTLIQVSRNPAQIHWEVVRYALLNVGGREIHALAGPQRFREFLQGILHLAYWPDRIQEALLVVSVVYLLVRWWRARRETIPFKRDGLLLLWLTLPVLFFLRGKSPVYPHYLIPLYPAPYLALAIAAVDALQGIARLRTAKGWLYALAALPLAALIAWQSYLSLSIYAFVDRHDTPEGMGTPIRILREAARTIEHYAETWHSEQAVMVCPGDNPQWDECPAVFSFMTDRSLDLRFVDGRASLLFPQSGTDMPIVVAPGAGTVEEQLSHYAQELPAARVALREGVGAYRFYRLPTGTAPQPPVQPAGAPIRLANGVSLLGFQISPSPQPGQVTRLELYWRVEDLPAEPPAQGYSFANHLLAADGQRCGQRDGPGYPVELWRPGDTLISSFDIDVPADAPPGPYTLRVGMYVYTPPDQFATVHVVDAAGQPISSAVEWPLP